MSEKSIGELLADISEPYTRERYDADYARITARICEKHGIAEDEIGPLIRDHRYQHDAEDIEDEWIGIMAFARVAGWPPFDRETTPPHPKSE